MKAWFLKNIFPSFLLQLVNVFFPGDKCLAGEGRWEGQPRSTEGGAVAATGTGAARRECGRGWGACQPRVHNA